MSRFDILISGTEATPIYRGNLGPRAVGVRLSWIHPGGCDTCAFRIYAPINFVPSYIGKFFGVKVMDGGEVIWAGRMEEPAAHIGPDGRYWNLVAKGYGVNLDDQSYSSQNVRNTVTSTIVADVITNLTQQIDATSITATGFTISNTADVNLTALKAHAAINWARQFGDSSNNPQVWYVEPDPDGTIRFTFKPRPTTADYQGYLRDFISADFGLAGRQLYNRVNVIYTGGTSTVDDATLQGAGPAGWGFIRELDVQMPELSNATDATQAGNAILTQVKIGRMAARGPLVVKRGASLLDGNGHRLKLWQVRAGRLFKFRDVDPADGAGTNLAYNNTFLTAGVEFDEDRQTLTIQPESFDTSLDAVVARSRALLTGRHTV